MIELPDARGWPRPALWQELEWTQSSRNAEVVRGGVAARTEPSSTRHLAGLDAPLSLPILPLWSGVAIDTTVFAAGWLALLAIPGTIRSAGRRCRGRCPRCGYDWRGAETCPECGRRRRRPHSGQARS